MVVGPPDFVGVGAQKAGTTWWYQLLVEHPLVHNHPGVHKERHFFMRFFDRAFDADDAAEYHRWFPRPPGFQAGEWTPDYMLHFWIPRLLKHAAPDTKVLVLLRDPVERIVSGLTHVAARQAVPDARAATEAYLRGRYAEQLEGLGSYFDPSRILVQQYEKCRRDPPGELRRTLAFLGLPPMVSLRSYDSPVNETVVRKVSLPAATRDELVALYRRDVEKLVLTHPEIDVGLWPNFSFIAR
ncbi:MAG: sulfotransferase domain-containing protein [Acidimicrobiales bacterium]